MAKRDQSIIVLCKCQLGTGEPSLTTTQNFEITDELPADHRSAGPLYLCFAELRPGEWNVHLRFSTSYGLPGRFLKELTTGVAESPGGGPVFDSTLLATLERRGLTKEAYVALVQRLFAEIQAERPQPAS